MAQYPPAPPPPGGATPGTRPGIVTAAAVLLLIGGGLAVLGGLLLLAGAGVAAGSGVGGIFALFAILLLAVGAVEIYAGVKVLQLKEIGRRIGIIVAAVGALLSLISIARTPSSSVIGILIDAFIIYSLYTNEQHFTA